MKPLAILPLVLLFALSANPPFARAENPPKPQGEVIAFLESQTAGTNRTKYAFAELAHPCANIVRYYRNQTTTITNNYQISETGASPAILNFANTNEYQYTSAYVSIPSSYHRIGNGITPGTCAYFYGVYAVDSTLTVSGSSKQSSGPCSYILAPTTNFTTWDSSCDWTPPHGGSSSYSVLTSDHSIQNGVYYLTGPGDGSTDQPGVVVFDYHSTVETINSDEYLTTELLTVTGFDYTNDWARSGTESPHASTFIGPDEFCAGIQKMRFRFNVYADAGQHYSIYYTVHFQPQGGAETNWEDHVDGTGTGGWSYSPQVEFAPPSATFVTSGSCTNTVGGEKWITLGCSPTSPGGCSACNSGGSVPGSVSAQNDCVNVRMSLGLDFYGQASGFLGIASQLPTPSLFTPAGLVYAGNQPSTILITNAGVLRQVLAPQTLVDIFTNNPTQYTINFYTNPGGLTLSGGVYPTSGSPFTTVTVQEVSSTNQLRITISNGSTTVYDYVWSDPNKGWTLSSGGGIRSQSVFWDTAGLIRTNTVMNGSSQIVYQEVTYFTNLASYGVMPIKKVVDPSGAALTSQWAYYDNAGTDGTNYGLLKREIQPSGFWTSYQYDTNNLVTSVVSQFLNAATNAANSLCRVVQYDYTPLGGALRTERRIELLLGQEIARQYTLTYPNSTYLIQCQTPGAAWNAADNLVTITTYYPDGTFVEQVQSILNPDGTMEIYQYWADGAQKITTVSTGVPSGDRTAIIDGTQTTTVTGLAGELQSRTEVDLLSSITTASESYAYDYLNRLTNTTYNLDGTTVQKAYDCCTLSSQIDRDGTPTTYSYDALKRLLTTTRNSVTISNTYDANNNVLVVTRFGSDNSAITQSQSSYDRAGRIMRQTNALNGVTITTNTFDGFGQTVITNTNPDLGTRIQTYAQDGSLLTVGGTASHPLNYAYGVESDGGVQRAYTLEVKLSATGGTNEWTKTYSDMLGRSYKTVYAAASGGPFATSYYNNLGQLTNQVDPDGVSTLYVYNAKGEKAYQVIDANTNGVIDYGGADRITFTTNDVVWDNGAYVRRTCTFVWNTISSNTSNLISTAETSVDGLNTWKSVWNKGTAITTSSQTTRNVSIGSRTVTSTAADASYRVDAYLYGQLVSKNQYDANGSLIAQTTYGYDTHGRQNTVTDARTGTATSTFSNADQESSITTPSPGGGQSAQITTNLFDNMGRVWKSTLPDNTSITNEFYLTGQTKRTYGSRTYPVGYGYDAQGRMTKMTNWSSFAAQTGTRVTTWNYDSYRGFFTSKVYDGSTQGPAYDYTGAGRLLTRWWARGTNATCAYNGAGDLLSTIYNDGFTPGMTNGYDRRGRLTSIINGTVVCTMTYNDAGNLLSESYVNGPLDGISITNGYDSLLRRTNNVTLLSGVVLTMVTNNFDAASRLSSISDQTNSATYSYLANSPLVSQIDFQQSGATRMTTTKSYDNLNRLTGISSTTNSAAVASFGYQYNSANQRTQVTNTDNSDWVYQYDSLGQVTSGKKYWSDGTPVAGGTVRLRV